MSLMTLDNSEFKTDDEYKNQVAKQSEISDRIPNKPKLHYKYIDW